MRSKFDDFMDWWLDKVCIPVFATSCIVIAPVAGIIYLIYYLLSS